MRFFLFILLTLCITLAKTNAQVAVYQSFEDLQTRISAHSDTVFVINFWATWCAPCTKEIVYFEELKTRVTKKPVQILLVSLDYESQINRLVLPFVKEQALTCEVIVLADKHPENWTKLVYPAWKGTLPATLFVHAANTIFHQKGFKNASEIEVILKNL